MGRNSVFVAIAFFAGIAVGFGARSVRVLAMPQSDTRAANLAAIEKLHQEDIQVTLSQNEKGLTDIWTDDAVRSIRQIPRRSASRPSGLRMRSSTHRTQTLKS